jgi:hypothetical protein
VLDQLRQRRAALGFRGGVAVARHDAVERSGAPADRPAVVGRLVGQLRRRTTGPLGDQLDDRRPAAAEAHPGRW